MSINIRKGLRFENQARVYLQQQGLKLLQSNFRCRFGEIDLIMRDRHSLCFIEVRFRKSIDYGGASASITAAKQRRIVKAGLVYLAQHERLARLAPRFDALLIQQRGDELDYDWIQNAFYAE